jgi:hypothetical protein
MRYCRIDGLGPCQNDKRSCSVSKTVSEQQTVPLALSPCLQVENSPLVQDQTCSKTRSNHPYGPQMAVSSLNLCFPGLLQHRHLDVLRRCQRDGVHVKRSKLNIISIMNPAASLASCADPGNCPYLPGLVPRESGHHGRSEQDCKGLRVCYTLRNQGGRRICCSPEWCERRLRIKLGRVTNITCYITTIKHVHVFASKLTGSSPLAGLSGMFQPKFTECYLVLFVFMFHTTSRVKWVPTKFPECYFVLFFQSCFHC